VYTERDFKTKKAVKTAIAAGERIGVYSPGIGNVPENGRVSLEGPHFPKPHTWYGTGTVRDGLLVAIK
jgi:hypothetical protein